MVVILPALCIPGCVQGSSELSYRQVAARDYRVPEGVNRHSVTVHSTFVTRLISIKIVPLNSKVRYLRRDAVFE